MGADSILGGQDPIQLSKLIPTPPLPVHAASRVGGRMRLGLSCPRSFQALMLALVSLLDSPSLNCGVAASLHTGQGSERLSPRPPAKAAPPEFSPSLGPPPPLSPAALQTPGRHPC